MGVENIQCAASSSALPLMSLNHVSFVCRSVAESARFYQRVLGFTLIKRPSSFDFKGAWLFKYGIGIHLLESDAPNHAPAKKSKINPKDNHISFQCSDMGMLVSNLKDMNIDYVTATVVEDGIKVDQLFFHDPDGYMIEICNCNNLPVQPLITDTSDGLPAAVCPLARVDSRGRNEQSTLQMASKLNCPDAVKGQQVGGMLLHDIMGTYRTVHS